MHKMDPDSGPIKQRREPNPAREALLKQYRDAHREYNKHPVRDPESLKAAFGHRFGELREQALAAKLDPNELSTEAARAVRRVL